MEGKRVVCDGDYGTIKYFGEVPPSHGLWYGVEWDVDGRGKHSGEYEGVKYFTCSRPGNGSFVRGKKLDFGVDVLEALANKFSELHSKDKFSHFDCVYHVGKDEGGASEEKLQRLERVSLRGTNVSHATDRSLGLFVPNIAALDLSNTLLCDWQEVIKIVKDLPRLTELDVSGMRLKPDSFVMKKNELKTVSLKTLVLNYMHLDWHQVLSLISIFSALEELHASFNLIHSLKCEEDSLVCSLGWLRKLNLEGNNLSKWEEVFLLHALPCLEVLVLNDNPLGDFSFPGDIMKTTNTFSKLKSMALVKTKVSSWSCVDQLNRLKLFKVLGLKYCPLVHDVSEYDARQELIARVAMCSVLNGSAVTVKERKTAERAYLKKYGQEWLASGGNTDVSQSEVDSSFIMKHPRYVLLLEVHGVPDGLGVVSGKVNTLKSSLIVVTCINDASKQSVSKKLPASMTISKLKGLLQRTFKVLPSSQMLSYVDQDGHEIKLEDDLKPLSFYSVASGGIIHLSEKRT